MEISRNARVWIYQSDRPFNNDELDQIQQALHAFVNQWEAHAQKLAAHYEIRYSRFIILMVDESYAGASGCSIDKSVNLLKDIESRFNVNLFDRFNIAYKNENEVLSCNRETFEDLISSGRVTEDTIVFNNLVTRVEDLEHNWEVPLKASWHATVFGGLLNA